MKQLPRASSFEVPEQQKPFLLCFTICTSIGVPIVIFCSFGFEKEADLNFAMNPENFIGIGTSSSKASLAASTQWQGSERNFVGEYENWKLPAIRWR